MMWKKILVSDLCTIVRGSSPRPKGDPKYYGGQVPRLMIEDITRDGKYVTPKIDFLTPEGALLSRPMKKGDLVITVSGRPGVPAILATDACIHDGFVGFRNLSSEIDVEFLYHYLSFITEKTNYKSVGAIFKNLTTEQIKNLEITIPPIKIQKQISATLEKAEDLLRKDNLLLKKYDELAQSIFFDMFGDPHNNEKGWEIKKLEELCLTISDIDHNMPKAVDNGIPFISAKDLSDDGSINFANVKLISEADFKKLSRKIVPQKGDIIYSRIGAKLGKARKVLTDDQFLVSYSCCTIRPDVRIVNADYLCYFLDSPICLKEVQKKIRSIGVPDLGMDEVRNIKVIYPPIALQSKYAKALHLIYRNRTILLQNKASSLFMSLMNQYFS